MKHISCVEKRKEKSCTKWWLSNFVQLFKFKNYLKVCMKQFKHIYIMFRKDEKGKLHKVVVVEPAGGKNRRQKFVRAIKGRCSIIYFIFSTLILYNRIL